MGATQGPKKRKTSGSRRNRDGLQREALGFGSVKTFVSGTRPFGHFNFTEKITRTHCAALTFFRVEMLKNAKTAPFARGIL